MTNTRKSYIYYLSPEESRISTYCQFCKKQVGGIAIDGDYPSAIFTILISCHGMEYNLKITEDFIKNINIRGFQISIDGGLIPWINVPGPRLKVSTLTIEMNLRKAKEKVFTKIYGRGELVTVADSKPLDIVRAKRRRIIIGNKV